MRGVKTPIFAVKIKTGRLYFKIVFKRMPFLIK